MIKNKFLRFLISILTTLILYYLLVFFISGDANDVNSVLEGMIIFAVFGAFIVLPTLFFAVYIIYQLLTKKENRSKRLVNIIKYSLYFLLIMTLLYLAAMYTDLFG